MKREQVFRRYRPSPRGLARLSARLDAPKRVRWLPVSFATAALALFFVVRPAEKVLPMSPALIGLGLQSLPAQGVTPGAGAVVKEVQMADANVVFFWVASTETATPM